MAEIDVVDEAIIDADPATVYKALINEVKGSTHWWMPYWESKPRGDITVGQVGAITDITAHSAGTTKFTVKTTEIIENKLIRVEFVEGDFLGDGEWTLVPENGKTKIRFRWKVRPNRFLTKLMSRFVNIGKIHSKVMQAGFEGLNKYLKQKK
jgi:uncharacterized protein YndB with AHSA1/START domain